MASTFFGLTISYSGLQAASTSLNVTGHNVSNINTTGYSKQQASTEAAQALRTFSTYGMLGAGVKVTGVSQLRDSYYDEKNTVTIRQIMVNMKQKKIIWIRLKISLMNGI